MKILLVFVFVFGAAAALGSGPYLPSGWRPKGPAFLLPTEIQESSPHSEDKAVEQASLPTSESSQNDVQKLEELQPSEAPSSENLQDASQESEASGSDFLREYGPPASQDFFKDITVQALPALETERPFVVIEARFVSEGSLSDDSASLEEIKEVTEAQFEVKSTLEPIFSTVDSENVDVKEESSVSIQDDLSEDISSTEAAVQKVTSAIAAVTVQEIATVEGITTESIDENISVQEESNLIVKADVESPVSERGSLEYLPVAENEVGNNDDGQLKAKSNVTPEEDDSSLEYLPPFNNAEKNEQPIPLFKAKLEVESQVNVNGNLEYLPPAQESESSSGDKVDSEIVSVQIVSEEHAKSSDVAVVNEEVKINIADDEPVEGSGLESIPEKEEVTGFREYGPPREVDAKERSDSERIENNEMRKRRFSSKFSRKH